MEIIDNFLQKSLIEFLEKHFLYKTPHIYGHNSTPNSGQFYSANLNINDPMIAYVIQLIKEKFPVNEVLRSYINIQFHGMDGDWHKDDGKHTVLIMLTPSLEKGSGQFHFKDSYGETVSVDFLQNRLIYFGADTLHKGCAPSEKNTARITLAFKTI